MKQIQQHLTRRKVWCLSLIHISTAEAGTVKDLLDGESISYQMSQDGLIFYVDAKDEAAASILLGKNDIPSQGASIDNVFDGGFSSTAVSYTHLSTLQQEASKALNFPISKTMRIAQQLYEGVDVKGQGTVGLITYFRTDSVSISEEADAQAREYIAGHYGENYIAGDKTTKKNGAKIQDAHEAIRPSDINRTRCV